MDGVARRRADKQLPTRDTMKETTTENTEGDTTIGDFCRPPNDSESLAESCTKTTVCENDNLEMIGLGHVGMYAKNPASLAEFYREVMGMQIVDCSDASHPLGASAFLSSHPREGSHQIAMFSNPELAHRAFKVGSLAALKRFYQKIVGGGIPIKFAFLHGVSFAFYFEDPEGNAIEVFWPTGLEYHPQPYAQKIDLTKTEEELMNELKALTGQKDFTSPTNANKAL
jgi:catechol 2,3-dioxygenase-like lactoylglutathione lyase family enzyme